MEMLENFRFIKEIFWECSNNFQYMGLLIGALIYLYCFEKKSRPVRRMVCFSMLFFFLFMFPPFVAAERAVMGDTQVARLLWTLPFVLLVPYAAVAYGKQQKSIRAKVGWCLFCLVLVLLAGDGHNEQPEGGYKKAESEYSISEEEMEICKILEDAEEDALLLPANLSMARAVRREVPSIELVYGANMGPKAYKDELETLYAYMEGGPISLELIFEITKEEGVNYIVFDKEAEYTVPVQDIIKNREAELLGETEHYWVLRMLY